MLKSIKNPVSEKMGQSAFYVMNARKSVQPKRCIRAYLNRENNVHHKLAILEEQIHIEREGTIAVSYTHLR